jgi:D-inositol-3-phosphate glycosyltransferase
MLSAHSCPVGNLGAKDTGGMSVYVREIARELGKQGILVDVYTRVHDPKDNQIVELGQNARLIHLRAGEGKDMHKLAVYPYLPDFVGNLENFRKHNNLRYDLVFSHYWLSGWAGKYLQRWWNVPHVMVFHTLGAVKNAIGIGEEEPELRIETEMHLTKNCHRIISTTEREKADLILGFGDGKSLLFVGRIEPLKGIDRLLQAMTYLQNGHGLRAVIIGGDGNSCDEVERLQRLSRELHIEDSVTFLGMIKHEKLPCFYSAATACVIPSYYESFGLVALESIACGTPVVATNVGALKSIIHQGETGYVVMDDTPRSLADKIALLLSSPDARSAPSIRASVTRFSWSNIAQQIINEVLASYFTQGHKLY